MLSFFCGGLVMKKTKLLYVALATQFLLSGCASKEEIKFPFDASDVNFIEIYHYSVPGDVHESRLPGNPYGLAMKPIAGTGLMPGHYIAQGYDKYLEPTIDLYADKKATLFYSTLSGDLPMGEFTIEDGTLVLPDEMFDKKYTFVIDGKDLIFQADKSAEIPRLEENTLRDGTRFVYQAEN